eukprot:CAMPEP_0183730884 /NCGR_PEP_ID=MMETSP0737-20130205/33767_1 /TAXON_ID=385413 /ORGANISM="Thalassiosira miniscula, Strain CCMP1093" /LENGTH=261 /DNA_ID=CAMNT_0025963475 /DNA_START=198 /DNA_END=983 /DNA_ORIENTATION=-
MLKQTVAVVQGQQHQQESGDIRRLSEPNLTLGLTNGSIAAPQQPPQALVGQSQGISAGAFQPQNNTASQPQQHQGFGQQANVRHHSFASSMDLISTNHPTSQINGASNFQPFQDHLFKSSSHHTSHTAAAGDLLTMSRRSLCPPPPDKSNGMIKKRSSTMVDTNSIRPSQSSVVTMNGFNSRGRHNSGATNPQQQVPQFPSMKQIGGFFPSTQEKSLFNYPRSSVSSSTVGTMGDEDDSYHHHRTIRRCIRSESVDMMDDG